MLGSDLAADLTRACQQQQATRRHETPGKVAAATDWGEGPGSRAAPRARGGRARRAEFERQQCTLFGFSNNETIRISVTKGSRLIQTRTGGTVFNLQDLNCKETTVWSVTVGCR